jgi:predicted RNase H-like nuclease (RuvC/YqgF family)
MKLPLFRTSTAVLFAIIALGCNQSQERKSAALEGTIDSLKQTCNSLDLKLSLQERSITELSIKVERMDSLNNSKNLSKNLSKKTPGKHHKMR